MWNKVKCEKPYLDIGSASARKRKIWILVEPLIGHTQKRSEKAGQLAHI